MRLATFNILNGRSIRDGRVDLDRFCAAICALDADVLCLQEVDRGQPRSHGADLTDLAASAMHAVTWRFAPAVRGTPGLDWAPVERDDVPDGPSYGVSLLSRHPVSDWEVIRLRPLPVRIPLAVPGPQRFALVKEEPRVALVARVKSPDGPVTVASTHLAFVPGWNFRQLDVIRKRVAGETSPVVIAGDLNLPGRLARLRDFHPLARVPTYPAPGPRVQLDHLLARGRIRRIGEPETPELAISDHRALIVECR